MGDCKPAGPFEGDRVRSGGVPSFVPFDLSSACFCLDFADIASVVWRLSLIADAFAEKRGCCW
jgi:hypothetical protein